MRRVLIFFGVALVVAGALGVAWWRVEGPSAVRVVRPARGPAVEAVYATGTVEPVRWAQLASTETGRIVAYPAREGHAVKAGDMGQRLVRGDGLTVITVTHDPDLAARTDRQIHIVDGRIVKD